MIRKEKEYLTIKIKFPIQLKKLQKCLRGNRTAIFCTLVFKKIEKKTEKEL